MARVAATRRTAHGLAAPADPFSALNAEQRAAVEHGDDPLLVIAGAGTGKTMTLAARVARLVLDGVDPQRLGVYGYSAGGHLSLMLGTASDEGNPKADDPLLRISDRVQAVVAMVAPTDLRIMVWKAPDHLPAYDKFPALDLAVAGDRAG